METVDQSRARIEAFIQENAPDIDISPGSVFGELLTQLTADATNEVQNQLIAVEAAKTVQDVLNSAEDTYSDTIDRLASNYDTYRNEGKKANGQIKVVVNKNKNYFIPTGFTFLQPNLNFTYTTVTDYSISATSTPVQLKQDGQVYYFVIPVEASEVGKDKQVSYGTKFQPASGSTLPEFIEASAIGSFEQGEDKETDKELITRFKLGLSTKNLVSPMAVEAVLKDRYPSFRAVSLRGVGDPEDLRGTDNPFGITIPGMVDVYVRMAYALPTTTITRTGTRNLDGTWSLTIPADAVPGFYKVVSVITHGGSEAGTQHLVNVSYGYDLSMYQNKNMVNSAIEARFSKYQTAVVTFDYDSVAATEPFDVTLLYQPQVADVQAAFLDSTDRIPCADYLVKAVVPCNVSVDIKLVKSLDFDEVNDPTSIKSDIFNYINGLAIGEAINASKIIDICHNYNIKRVDLPVQLKGTIIVPYALTDESVYISGTDTLTVPNLPEKGVTPYTTAFFVNYFDESGHEAIGVSVT